MGWKFLCTNCRTLEGTVTTTYLPVSFDKTFSSSNHEISSHTPTPPTLRLHFQCVINSHSHYAYSITVYKCFDAFCVVVLWRKMKESSTFWPQLWEKHLATSLRWTNMVVSCYCPRNFFWSKKLFHWWGIKKKNSKTNTILRCMRNIVIYCKTVLLWKVWKQHIEINGKE